MKKLLLLTAFMLSGLMISAQETVEANDHEISFTITPRLDITPYFTTQSEGENQFSFGNSSLYTSFIGDINDHWSFMLVNHWLANNSSKTFLFADTHYLYDNTFHTDYTNWMDFCNITYSVSGFSFTLGKDMIATGGFEYDAWDWEVHSEQMSGLWNNLTCYQWGGKVSWTTPAENTTIGVQMTTSPYTGYLKDENDGIVIIGDELDEPVIDKDSYRPFKSGRYNYSMFWMGDFDWFHTNISLTALQRYDWSYSWLAAAGLRFTPGQFTIDANWFNKVGRDADDFLAKGNTGILSLTYTLPSDKFDFTVKGCYEKVSNPDEGIGLYDDWFTGLSVNWYPVFGADIFRIHGAVSYDHYGGYIAATVGVLFNIDVLSFIK